MSKLTLSVLLFLLGQIAIWFQTNGQFLWKWFANNPLILSVVGGSTISYAFIYATKFAYEHFDGLLWPQRFIAFACGIIVFSFLTWYLKGEGITTKTMVSLGLSFIILSIQILWK